MIQNIERLPEIGIRLRGSKTLNTTDATIVAAICKSLVEESTYQDFNKLHRAAFKTVVGMLYGDCPTSRIIEATKKAIVRASHAK